MISVITPSLNILEGGRHEYFEKMVRRVNDQTYSEIELIVVDGCSTDGTIELLEQYVDAELIHQLALESAIGPYPAMNKGLHLAAGDYIAFMCTDDYLLDTDFYRRSIDLLEENCVDFTHADRLVRSRSGKPDWVKKGDETVAFFRMPFRHETMVFRRDVFEDIGVYDESYRVSADYKHVMQMLIAGKKGLHIPETVLFSLDGGLTSDRALCIREVSRALHEVYGARYGLSRNECQQIYERKITHELHSKIQDSVADPLIAESLKICYELSREQ